MLMHALENNSTLNDNSHFESLIYAFNEILQVKPTEIK